MLDKVRAVDFFDRLVFPRPRETQVVDNIHAFKGNRVDVEETLNLLLARTQIQFHAATFFLGASQSGWLKDQLTTRSRLFSKFTLGFQPMSAILVPSSA